MKAEDAFLLAMKRRGAKWLAAGSGCLIAWATAAGAGPEISFYSGVQGASGSTVNGTDVDGARISFSADWEGDSFSAPPYYGGRVTYWWPSDWGLSLDASHSKLYADDATLARSGFGRLEFTDGLNPVTLNALRRFPRDSLFTPYVGLGIGISIPHVETSSPAAAEQTFEYQFGGPVLQAQAGVAYALRDRWSLFAEYKGNYVRLDVDMSGGGDLQTDVFTHALNIGVTRGF